MFPAEIDYKILETLPLISEDDVKRITVLLQNIISMRVLPYFKKNRGTDPIAVARAERSITIKRLEDDQGRVRAASLIERDGENWTIYIHERVFDYFSFIVPGARSEIHVSTGTPEEQKTLALGEFLLRHQIEHILYPDKSARQLIQSDINFVLEKKKSDPTFYKILRRAMADDLNGIKLDRYIRSIDLAEDKRPVQEIVTSMLNSYAEMIADLPDERLYKKFIHYDTELKTKMLGLCFSRADDAAYSILVRAAFVQKLLKLFADLVENDAPEAELVFNNFRQVWGLMNLFRELDLTEVDLSSKDPKELFEYFKNNVHLVKEKWHMFNPQPCPPPPLPKAKASPVAIKSLADRIEEARDNPLFPMDVLAVIEKNKANTLGQSGSKYSEFIETLLSIPWGKIKKIDVPAEVFESGLHNSHFGLQKPKEIISDFFANLIWRYKNDDLIEQPRRGNGSAFLFVGPPGVGKTSLAVSIAENLAIPYHKISLGGMSDEAELRGHGFTYEGSKPGAILQGLIKMGVMNGMFIMDEADKAEKFAISTLLEILDPEQNHLFHDKYAQTTIDIDLSNCHFILTANSLENVPPPVVNRCEVVILDRYSVGEKIEIARKYLVNRIRQKYDISAETVSFEPKLEKDVLTYMIKNYTYEAGVRQLERVIRNVFLRALRKEVLSKKKASVRVTRKQIRAYLEEPRRALSINDEDGVGETLGLGVNTELGLGSLIPVQVTSIKGATRRRSQFLNAVHATGNIEKIMDESRIVATTAILNCAEALGIDMELMKSPFHFHFMGGSTPKDGPSAGGAIALALASLLLGQPVRREVAMTGEIDTQGRISTIGGLDIKLETAYDAGCKTVIVPMENLEQDSVMTKLSKTISKKVQALTYTQWKEGTQPFDHDRHGLQVIGVDHILEAAEIALIKQQEIESLQSIFTSHLASGPEVAETEDCLPINLETDETNGDAYYCVIRSTSGSSEKSPQSNSLIECKYARKDPAAFVNRIVQDYAENRAGVTLALLAPYRLLSKIRPALEPQIGKDQIIYLANNHTAQGIQMNSCRSLFSRLLIKEYRRWPEYLDQCPFMKKLKGIYVLDLSFIPEKYRIDKQRAEKILKEYLTVWNDRLQFPTNTNAGHQN